MISKVSWMTSLCIKHGLAIYEYGLCALEPQVFWTILLSHTNSVLTPEACPRPPVLRHRDDCGAGTDY